MLTVAAAPAPVGQKPIPGRLANKGFEGKRIHTTLFFSGQAWDGSNRYGQPAGDNRRLYTLHPSDERHLKWSENRANRDFALGKMTEAGINVVTMSSWGEAFLSPKVGWVPSAPMQTSPQSHDELFEAAVGKNLLIMPLIESRADWAFRDSFPRWTDGKVCPGLVSQINELIQRYIHNAKHPEWAGGWAKIYDRKGTPRYAVVLIHAGSTRLGAKDHKAFADGFNLVADEVFKASKVHVGFLLDVLPETKNAPASFKPSPEATGPLLHATDAVLGIQCFVPEVWTGSQNEAELIKFRKQFGERWSKSGLPYIMDVAPGYDNSIVFPKTKLKYGYTQKWRDAQSELVARYGTAGMVYNSWNGYTEGMAAMPTKERKDVDFQWLKVMNMKLLGK